MTTKIEIAGIKFHAYHGVSEQERIVGNNFEVDIVLKADLRKAIETDQLDDTVNYASIYTIVKEEMSVPSALLEHVGGRILKSIQSYFPQITELSVKISKLCPPLGADIDRVAVVIESAN